MTFIIRSRAMHRDNQAESERLVRKLFERSVGFASLTPAAANGGMKFQVPPMNASLPPPPLRTLSFAPLQSVHAAPANPAPVPMASPAAALALGGRVPSHAPRVDMPLLR